MEYNYLQLSSMLAILSKILLFFSNLFLFGADTVLRRNVIPTELPRISRGKSFRCESAEEIARVFQNTFSLIEKGRTELSKDTRNTFPLNKKRTVLFLGRR